MAPILAASYLSVKSSKLKTKITLKLNINKSYKIILDCWTYKINLTYYKFNFLNLFYLLIYDILICNS